MLALAAELQRGRVRTFRNVLHLTSWTPPKASRRNGVSYPTPCWLRGLGSVAQWCPLA